MWHYLVKPTTWSAAEFVATSKQIRPEKELSKSVHLFYWTAAQDFWNQLSISSVSDVWQYGVLLLPAILTILGYLKREKIEKHHFKESECQQPTSVSRNSLFTVDFRDWAPLRLLDSELLSRVRLAYVFGDNGYETLMVTDEDEVLACGEKMYDCLGLKKDPFLTIPVRVPGLSKEKVKGFAATIQKDASFVCVYTVSGKMYYWCGKFASLNPTTRPTVFPNFSKKVSHVACGEFHCSILSTEGEVFCFGANYHGQLGNRSSTDSLSTPTLVQGDLKGRIVTKLACGTNFSVCVLDNGKVYGWGSNHFGQLGRSSTHHNCSYKPTKVPNLKDVIVRKIICGSRHVLAISEVGELFSWGNNSAGQLGLGDTSSRREPTKIEIIGKVINIAAVKESSTCAAMTENFEVYMWGGCGGLNLLKPTKTHFETMDEVYAFFSNPRIMYKPMDRHFQLPSVGENIKYSFGDTETSDLTVIVEDKEIFVHKVILKLRSNYFKVLLQEPWGKEDDKSISINQDYDGMYAYLQYIYTGNLKATPEVALKLLKIADEYNDIVLMKICEKSIRQGITVENVAYLYSLALKLGAKKLAKYCMSFAGNHVTDVIQTPGFSEWDKDTYEEFIMDCGKRKIFRS